jgi:tetratricopeptide (TPR) repeat protein
MSLAEPRSAPSAEPSRAELRAREARRRGLEAANAARPAVGARHVRAGLLALGWAEGHSEPDPQQVPESCHSLAGRLLVILAALEAAQGRTAYGLRLLDRAAGLAGPGADDRGVLAASRGLLLRETWRSEEALHHLNDAVDLLEGSTAEVANLAVSLLNRSFLYLNRGDVRRARADLDRCQHIAADAGLSLVGAKTTHNLGYCELLAGDIPAALQLFNAAAGTYRASAPGMLPVLAMDKARALLAAGLADDAARELDTAMAEFRQQRLNQDLAEAELDRSRAALAAGELALARRWAAAAGRRFRRQGNEACACVAELTRLRAQAASPGRRPSIAAQAQQLAGRLHGYGLRDDGDTAELIAARALIAAGRPGEAAGRIAAVRRRGTGVALEVSLLRRLARAELAELQGRPGAALAELRAALAMVGARRGRLGSLDLQTGTAALGVGLAAAGLRLALDRGSAPLIFAWLERSRAQAFRVRPVRPPPDPEVAETLAELRQLDRLVRDAELSGTRESAMITRRAGLQREIREHSWQAGGLEDTAAQASPGEVSAALAESGQVLACILVRGGRMHALVLGRDPVSLVALGDFEAAAEAARRLSADLDALAGRRLPARMEAVIRESARRQALVLTAEILAPLRPSLGDAGVILAPAGALAGIPWSMLPELRGRPVTVCPSASSWLAAWRRGQAPARPGAGPPLLAAGPDLRHAQREVTAIAKVYPGCRPLLAAAATVRATLRALDGAPLAHLAAHGHHDRENVLFSRLDLADGPLMAYDLQQLAAVPRQVVLSACDVGQTVVRPGGEFLGLTAALLYAGTATVISSVTRVADDGAVSIMTAYHRALAAGARPAEALARAGAAEPLTPFVCFGSG